MTGCRLKTLVPCLLGILFRDHPRSFDYAKIEDAALHVGSTSRDSGRALKDAASAAMVEYIWDVKDTGAKGPRRDRVLMG